MPLRTSGGSVGLRNVDTLHLHRDLMRRGKFLSVMIWCLWWALPLSHQKFRAVTYGICDIPLDIQLEER